MSSMLEKSLDEIIGSRPRQNRNRKSKSSRVGKPRHHSGRQQSRHIPTNGKLNEVKVTNLDPALTEQDIANLFNKVGETKSVELKINTHGVSTGIAYIEYFNSEDAAEAIRSFHRRNAVGRTINVTSTASLSDRIGLGNVSKGAKSKKAPKPKKERPTPKSAEDLDKELSMYMETEGQPPIINQVELPPHEQVQEEQLVEGFAPVDIVAEAPNTDMPFPATTEIDME